MKIFDYQLQIRFYCLFRIRDPCNLSLHITEMYLPVNSIGIETAILKRPTNKRVGLKSFLESFLTYIP